MVALDELTDANPTVRHAYPRAARTRSLRAVATRAHCWWLLRRDDVVIVDVETTDLDGEICEIAIIDTQGRVLVDTLVKPGAPCAPEARAVHRINDSDLDAAPTWSQVWPTVKWALADTLVVAYNAPFDRGRLEHTCALNGLDFTHVHPRRWWCLMRARARVEQAGPRGGRRWVHPWHWRSQGMPIESDAVTRGEDRGGLWTDVSRVVAIAGPLYLSMLAASVSAIINSAVLGRTSTAALAAFALTGVVYFPAMAAVTGAVRGVMPFVASAVEDHVALRRVIGDGTWLALSIGLVGAVGVAAVPLLGLWTGVPQTTLKALGGFPWLMAGVVFVSSLGSMASSSLVAMERSHVVMRAGLAGALATIVLSPLLVLGLGPTPALGLEGAGVSLLVASLSVLTTNVLWLRRAVSFSLVTALRYGWSLHRTVELAKVGIPMAGTVLVKFGVLGVVALAVARISTDAAAGHNIATSVVGLVFTAAVAVGQAGIPLVSSRAAANDIPGIRRAVLAGVVVAGTVVAFLCLAMVLLDDQVIGVFSTDPAVVALMHTLMPLVALAIIADGLQAVFGFGLTGLKRSTASFIVFCAIYGLLALVALPIADTFGLSGLWATLAAINLGLVCGQAGAFWRASAAPNPRSERQVP